MESSQSTLESNEQLVKTPRKAAEHQTADGDEERKQAKLCHVPCYLCLNITKKNIQCGKCGKVACQLHSGVTKLGSRERTCDECIREMLRNELDDNKVVKLRIKDDIEKLLKNKETLNKNLNLKNSRIKNLQIEIKQTIDGNDKKKQHYTSTLSALVENNKKMEKEIEDWTGDIAKNTKNNEILNSTAEELAREACTLKKNLEEMIIDRSLLLNHLNELREFIRTQIPVKLIKKVICNKCYIAVQHKFASMFHSVVPLKQEHAEKPRQVKKGACASCNVF